VHSRRVIPFVVAALLAALPAGAQTAAPSPVPRQHVPLEERHQSGTHGSVDLAPKGGKTEVLVKVSAPRTTPANLTLHSGSDCLDTFGSPATQFHLNPLNGTSSRTLVSLPIGAFHSKHFVVDVRNATNRARFAEACARI
jgi:hypothetical protein